jgi:hypothetical protein
MEYGGLAEEWGNVGQTDTCESSVATDVCRHGTNVAAALGGTPRNPVHGRHVVGDLTPLCHEETRRRTGNAY